MKNTNYTPVTLEEYNASLRSTVNAYYEHCLNDPTMSREEAIQSTAQMAEEYLNAVDEFEAAQNTEPDVTEETPDVDDPNADEVDCDDGPDV